ncbi:exonuclease SbcCD subunit D [Anaerovorax odorimutans]|uniref:Nuclease SbcCD subunit D n=1 Tax=Anaerovorax odorimutans TaxID=109327 RepID=A0ABT1RKL0_9FIRM|nr:exonuclease SbcCD subunit D [Anaerovorax odorimutans]MCQ4635717.1 exonuclease SbcCD subunit D [Anaerovorax odorimutans]
MKLIHLSDLHLGKRVNGFSMIEDQTYILEKILETIEDEQADAVLIAGDVYDKSVPSAEAVGLFDDFLVRCSRQNRSVLVISGNHDSPERLAFGARLMTAGGIHVSPVYDGQIRPVTFEDDFGKINVYLLPFLKPAHVKAVLTDDDDREVSTYNEALRTAVNKLSLDSQERNILVTHQFVTGASRCDSEEISVGGTDNVDAGIFADFDYVALGHLHSPQNIRLAPEEEQDGETKLARYCGTPLKYSFSEVSHEKSLTIVEMKEKGDVVLRTVPLIPKREMREIRGSYMEVTTRDFYQSGGREDYLHITLTDEEDVFDAIGKLRAVYPNIMKLDYDNSRTRAQGADLTTVTETKQPSELFADFFRMQNGRDMSQKQENLVRNLIKEIWEDEK